MVTLRSSLTSFVKNSISILEFLAAGWAILFIYLYVNIPTSANHFTIPLVLSTGLWGVTYTTRTHLT